jgi:hypothetical protein
MILDRFNAQRVEIQLENNPETTLLRKMDGWRKQCFTVKFSAIPSEQRLRFCRTDSQLIFQSAPLPFSAKVADLLRTFAGQPNPVFTQYGKQIFSDNTKLLIEEPIGPDPIEVKMAPRAMARGLSSPLTVSQGDGRIQFKIMQQNGPEITGEAPRSSSLREVLSKWKIEVGENCGIFDRAQTALDFGLRLADLARPIVLHVRKILRLEVPGRNPFVHEFPVGGRISSLFKKLGEDTIVTQFGLFPIGDFPLVDILQKKWVIRAIPEAATREIRIVRADSTCQDYRGELTATISQVRAFLIADGDRPEIYISDDTGNLREDVQIQHVCGNLACSETALRPPQYEELLVQLVRESGAAQSDCVHCFNYHDYDFEQALEDLKRKPS